jgi:hypothetical protein
VPRGAAPLERSEDAFGDLAVAAVDAVDAGGCLAEPVRPRPEWAMDVTLARAPRLRCALVGEGPASMEAIGNGSIVEITSMANAQRLQVQP